MPCYYPHAHLHSSWTSPCPPPLPRPGPPFLITIPLKQLLLSVNDHVPCPLSLSLLFRGLLCVSLLSSLPLLLPRQTRAWASNWTPTISHLPPLPPWVEGPGGKEQICTSHPPPPLDFLPMKCLVLNYSHPTLIVIDWNSRGSGRMTDRLGSLRARPPRREGERRRGERKRGREKERGEKEGAREGEGTRRKKTRSNTKSHMRTIYSPHRVAGQIWTRAAKIINTNW